VLLPKSDGNFPQVVRQALFHFCADFGGHAAVMDLRQIVSERGRLRTLDAFGVIVGDDRRTRRVVGEAGSPRTPSR